MDKGYELNCQKRIGLHFRQYFSQNSSGHPDCNADVCVLICIVDVLYLRKINDILDKLTELKYTLWNNSNLGPKLIIYVTLI
jgi:hypothetical protein